MKGFLKFLLFIGIVGAIGYVVKNVLSPKKDEFGGSGSGVVPANASTSLESRPLGGKISDDLLKILVCPEDKGPLELVDDGKYLLNPRNGYRYPIRDGIPVMLIEEGKKNRTPAIASANGAGASTEAEKAG